MHKVRVDCAKVVDSSTEVRDDLVDQLVGKALEVSCLTYVPEVKGGPESRKY
jgi:hypothetical protein